MELMLLYRKNEWTMGKKSTILRIMCIYDVVYVRNIMVKSSIQNTYEQTNVLDVRLCSGLD